MTERTIGIYVFLRTLTCSPVRASTIAGEIAAGDTRQRRLLHGSGDVLDVARIDRGRHHAHQRHRHSDGRSRYLRQFKNGRIAKGLEPYRTQDLIASSECDYLQAQDRH